MTEPSLRPGDVLLFHGRGFVSWAIRKFDGSEVNHAAIALGEGQLGEAAGSGLQIAGVDEAIEKNDFCLARRLPRDDLKDVVVAATEYLESGRPYAYQQIVLLAILATTRQIPLPPIGRRFVRSALDHAAGAINAFLDRDGNRSMICSEFVYRCFEEAGTGEPPPYHLGIILGDMAFGGAGATLVDWALAQPNEDLPDVLPTSFGMGTMDPSSIDEKAEVDLAPLIAAYAEETGLADADMPPVGAVASFDTGQMGDVSDEELLGSLASFGGALARDTQARSFSVGGVLGGAAIKGAIEGIRRVSVDANFVTPGDLLRSPSLVEVSKLSSD